MALLGVGFASVGAKVGVTVGSLLADTDVSFKARREGATSPREREICRIHLEWHNDVGLSRHKADDLCYAHTFNPSHL